VQGRSKDRLKARKTINIPEPMLAPTSVDRGMQDRYCFFSIPLSIIPLPKSARMNNHSMILAAVSLNEVHGALVTAVFLPLHERPNKFP
jgi:hypothetical protein